MAKAPQLVVTGVHVPMVRFWAQVLVSPDRLQDVKHSILQQGSVVLRHGEVLEIDTMPGDETEEALTVRHGEVERLTGASLVAWNQTGDVTVYSHDADRVAVLTDPIRIALVDREPDELLTKAVLLHCETIDSIQVGGVHVYFDRIVETYDDVAPKDDLAEEGDPEDEAYRASMGRQAGLKAALEAEKLTAKKLRRFRAVLRGSA